MVDFGRKDALFAALDRGMPKKPNAPAPFLIEGRKTAQGVSAIVASRKVKK